MALQEIIFSLTPRDGYNSTSKSLSHFGVVGSGDLEVLISRKSGPDVDVKITTPVKGFDDIWIAVVTKAVAEAHIGEVSIEVNDNNATPFVVALRLRQSFAEATFEEGPR